MLPIGIDLGNGGIKLVMEGLQLYIPNVTAVGRERVGIGEQQDALSTLDVQIQSPLFKDGTRQFFVGKLAADQGTLANYMSPADKKSSSEQALVLYLTSIASAVLKHRERVGIVASDRTLREDVFAVSGVSLIEAFARGVRQDFEKRLQGEHVIHFCSPSKWGGWTIRLNITPKVVSEGNMAFIALCKQLPTRIRELTTSIVALAEIGELSTEFPVFEGGMINPSLSTGLQYGTASTLDNMLEEIREKTGVRNAFPGGRMELEQFLERKESEVMFLGKQYDIRPYITQHLNAAANYVFQKIMDKWTATPSIRYFYVLGGGAALLHPYLSELAQKSGMGLEFAPTLQRSRWLNAEGMYLTAQRLSTLPMNHA